MNHPVVHFEVWGKDGGAMQGFYKKAFGWPMNVMKEMGYGMTQIKAGKGIEGGIFGSQPGQPQSGVTFYIETDNINSHLKKITKAGGKTIMPRTEIPGMVTFAQFADPAGNVVGLVEATTPPMKTKTKMASKGAAKTKAVATSKRTTAKRTKR